MDYALSPTQTPSSSSRRSTLRRAVRLETDVISDSWDGSVPFVATNLSPSGLWLESELPLDVGEEVLISLRPPRWHEDQEPLVALAEVARVGLYRRQREQRASGMGLRFLDLERAHLELLNASLRGLPPPLPKRSVQRRAPAVVDIERERPSMEEIFGAEQLVLADGSRFTLRAEGAFLTAGRGPMITQEQVYTLDAISSPMSAILNRRSPLLRIAG